MRADKFTTTMQEALGDAQSLAVTRDNPYIEPAHLLAAMLAQPEGPKALLDRAGANTGGLRQAMEVAINALPQVQGGQVQPGRELIALLQASEKEASKRGDQFIASEMFLLALADAKSDIGGVVRGHGLTRDTQVVRPFQLEGTEVRIAAHQHDIERGEVERGVGFLRHYGDASCERAPRERQHVVAVDGHAPGPRPQHRVDDAKKRRLAGSVRSQQADDRPATHVKRHAAEDVASGRSRTRRIRERDVID